MDVTTYSKFRQNLKSFMDKVVKDHNPLYISRSNGEDVVVISRADYESLDETSYLLRSPKNKERLLHSIQEMETGGGVRKDLEDLKD